jgi:lipoprotein-anchoring transpeptidase ErfK/SrfK
MMNRITVSSLIAAVTMIAFGIVGARNAEAQFFWGSGAPSGSTVYDVYDVSFPKSYSPGQIIVSFGDRKLYYVTARGRARSYPIAVPRAQSRWSGTLRISQKRVNPPWTPTPTMRRENPSLPAFVAGGDPRNPLGNRALYLGGTLYRIHGTDAPWTIGQNVSKGCIRMHNAHVAELYNRVGVGTKVVATWRRYAAETSTGGGGGAAAASGSDFAKQILGDNT